MIKIATNKNKFKNPHPEDKSKVFKIYVYMNND